MNLYMISLGGKVKGGNIEVHDVQFVVANHIDDTVEVLKRNWYGQQEKLHMDSYKVINGADGYAISVTKQKPESGKQLYFLHMGGYQEISTQEVHDVGIFAGDAMEDVKTRANKDFIIAKIENHVDSIVNIENCMHSADGEKYFLKLLESKEAYDCKPDWFGYKRLDR